MRDNVELRRTAGMGWAFLNRLSLFAVRAALILLFYATIYIIVGSWMFPEWWYGVFWDARFKDGQYMADGLRYLRPGNSILVLWIVGGIFVLLLFLMVFAGPVWRLVDRFSKPIAIVCIAAIM